MGYLVGPAGSVVSLDSDEHIVAAARCHLKQAGGIANVVTLQGDGHQGVPLHAPYDRLLATCSVRQLPSSWLAQLAQEGVLVSNVLLPLTSIFLRLENVGQSTFVGQILPIEGKSYMEIQTPGVIPPPKSGRGWKRYERLTYQEVALSCNLLDLLKDSAFRLFLHALYPTLRQRHRWQREEEEPEVYLVEQTNDEMAVLVQTDHLVVYGHDEQLAIHLKESINTFEELGHPSLEAYHIEVQEQRAMLVLGAHTFPLALLASGR